jgi:hypothetical protein
VLVGSKFQELIVVFKTFKVEVGQLHFEVAHQLHVYARTQTSQNMLIICATRKQTNYFYCFKSKPTISSFTSHFKCLKILETL